MKKRITKSFRRVFALFAAVVIATSLCQTPVTAESLSSDDGTMNVTTDGTNLYISYTGTWSGYVSQTITLSAEGTTLSAPNNTIQITGNNSGDSASLSVSNAYSAAYAGATATATNSDPQQYYGYGTMTYSATVPISDLGTGITALNITYNGATTSLAVADGASTDAEDASTEDAANTDTEDTSKTDASTEDATNTDTEDTSKTDASTEDAANTDTEDSSKTDASSTDATDTGTSGGAASCSTDDEVILTDDINMDGSYSEWDDVPETAITYLSNNTYQKHIGQLTIKDGKLYAHFKMNDLYDKQMRFQTWELKVNGVAYPITIATVDAAGNMTWQDMFNLPEGTTTNYGVFVGYYNDLDGKVAFTVHDGAHTTTGEGDEIEFSMSLEKLAKALNMEEDEMSTFTLKNPNIGNEGVTIAGTPTGATAGVLTALVMACAGAFVYTRSQRKDNDVTFKSPKVA